MRLKQLGNARMGYVFVILSALMFGSVSTLAKPIVSTLNPLLLSSIIYLIVSATLSPLAQKKPFPKSKKNYTLILAIAVCGSILAPSMYFVGLEHASASDAALIANGETFFSVLLAIAFFKEKLGKIGYLATAMIFGGIIIVTTDLNFSSITLQQIHYKDWLLILSMFFWGMDNNLSRILARTINVAKIAQIKTGIGGIILFVIAVFVYRVPIQIETSSILAILILGIFGFAASLYFFMLGLNRIGTVRTSLIFSSSSVFGLVSAAIFLHEIISLYQVMAAIVMILGMYLMNRKESIISPI